MSQAITALIASCKEPFILKLKASTGQTDRQTDRQTECNVQCNLLHGSHIINYLNLPRMMWHAVNSQTTITEICHHVPTMVTHQKTHYTRWLFDEVHIQCVRKKSDQMFFVVSSIELGQFWWNSVHGFLNKFATKICKRFPPHLNNVSTLPCETWNPHHAGATTALSEKETSEYYPVSTMASKFARFETQGFYKFPVICFVSKPERIKSDILRFNYVDNIFVNR